MSPSLLTLQQHASDDDISDHAEHLEAADSDRDPHVNYTHVYVLSPVWDWSWCPVATTMTEYDVIWHGNFHELCEAMGRLRRRAAL